MPLEIRRLARTDEAQQFDCGDKPLNTYLSRHAWNNQERNLLGVTFVAVDERNPKLVIGYYTLATSGIPRESLPRELTRDLPRYRNLPVALIARLAVDRRFQSSGVGKSLLRHALRQVLSVSQQIGCRFVIVDAYASAVSWYTKYGFVPINGPSPNGTQPMFIDVRTLEAASP